MRGDGGKEEEEEGQEEKKVGRVEAARSEGESDENMW